MADGIAADKHSDIVFRPCGEKDLPLLLSIQEETFAGLDDKSLLRCNTPAMLASCLAAPHYTLGAWVSGLPIAEVPPDGCGTATVSEGETLVAFSVLYFPQEAGEDLSLSLHAADTEGTHAVVANNKVCMVRKDFRGNGLQLRLGWQIECEAMQRGVQLLCATASPLNIASCRNLERQGYRLDCHLLKYGFPRNLYYKVLA